MNEFLGKLEELLTSPNPDFAVFITTLEAYQDQLNGLELAKSHGLLRLARALTDFQAGQAGVCDIAVLLRQVNRACHCRLEIGEWLWQPLKKWADRFGLVFLEGSEFRTRVLDATPWQARWLDDSAEIDLLEVRRKDPLVVGDGLLYAMSKSLTYQSEAQKAAIQASLFNAPGSTTLVTLPTGAGKSMCVLLPAWQSSRGGTFKGGTTLVIVPTISLALDQTARAREYFAGAMGPGYLPCVILGSTPSDEKEQIYKWLENGTLPILYTSPESLLDSKLYESCLKAAERGLLQRLVVDEAHLVKTWGAGFRTEFQFLSSYQKKLLQASKGRLRTLLLSATVSAECDTLLEQLFGIEGKFNRIQANRLRPEPGYWFNFSPSNAERERRVLEVLHYLPRPAILYVTRPFNAEQWRQALRREGYSRLETFTGETSSRERDRILKAWQANQVDIMIATSAFGLGVDKGDVRAIIHACLPENLDRFYQEVGRGGRDGCSSVSLTCITTDDKDLAFSMIKGERITSERAADRWEAMWRTAQGGGDLWALDIDATPPQKKGGQLRRTEANREWNEHTLLLMQRAKMLQLLDSREADIPYLYADGKGGSDKTFRLTVRLLSIEIAANRAAFIAFFEKVRQIELEEVQDAVEDIRRLVENYARPISMESCVAYTLRNLYPECTLACGGCPVCRKQGRKAYFQKLPVRIEVELPAPQAAYLQGELVERIGPKRGTRRTLNLFWEGPRDLSAIVGLDQFLQDLVQAGVQQLILPTEFFESPSRAERLAEQLATLEPVIPHLILPQKWLESDRELPLYPIPTALLYPPQDTMADEIYQLFQERYCSLFEAGPFINIFHRNLYLESENGLFSERVNGLTERLSDWQESLALSYY